jgi:hypothetical protein
MRLTKLIIPAAVAAFVAAPAVSAFPISSGAPAVSSGVTLVAGRHYDDDPRDGHYAAGHNYRHAPRGWHKHRHRPHDWQSNGCILVGPFWFCP